MASSFGVFFATYMLSVDSLSLTTAENKLEKQELIKTEKLKHKVHYEKYVTLTRCMKSLVMVIY